MTQQSRAQNLFYEALDTFTRKQHRDTFQVLLHLFLQARGKPHPHYSQVKSPAALSRFLNKYTWNLRSLIRVLRRQALQAIWSYLEHHRGRQPLLELVIDLTTLEKAGQFEGLDDWMHVYHAQQGVHLVVLYLCVGPLRFPWAFQVWRGKGTPSPQQLALKLLRLVPACLVQALRVRVLADGGFESREFMEGVRARGFELVVGVRCNRKLKDGTRVRDQTYRGRRVELRGLKVPMWLSWVWLPRAEGFEQRFVLSSVPMSGQHLARSGKRRWRIEGFFKTAKGRFGLERFGQGTKRGVFRYLWLSLLAYVLSHLEQLAEDAPGLPDWGQLAKQVRLTLLAWVRRLELQLELDELDAVLEQGKFNAT